jgi:fatty acid desaturase
VVSDPEIVSAVRLLIQAPYRSTPRIVLDVLLWVAAAVAAVGLDRTWATALAIGFIGAFPLHDLLVHGHEATHDLVSRRPFLNDALGWFTLALGGISLTAHREFHLEHHRTPHTAADPEFQLFNRVVPGVPGWAYLLIPFAAAAGVNSFPFRRATPIGRRRRVCLELLAALGLHAGLFATTGARLYLLFVLAPMFTGLVAATILRSVCEHHAVPEGDAWTNARSVATGWPLSFLWSNVNYHLEHHLFPAVPYHKLPALHRTLARECARHGSAPGRGYARTAAALLRERRHFSPAAAPPTG